MRPVRDDYFYRLKQIVKPDGIFPLAASTWWAGVKAGRYPKPIKLGPRISAWRGSDLNALIASLADEKSPRARTRLVEPSPREDSS